MRFAVVSAFLPAHEVPAIALEADRLGYHGFSVADHVVDLAQIETPYPYTSDGTRRWDFSAEWPDPWVLIGALAATTTHLRFFTSVYVAALRSPYLVAKSVGTAAVLSKGRVALGLGVGWCREEFELMEQDFGSRGRRTDEAIELMRRLWSEEWVERSGEHYDTPRLTMRPRPERRIPVLVGGLSDVALRRAARNDGWVGDLTTTAEMTTIAKRLRELRDEAGATGPFEVIAALSDAFLPEQFAEAFEGGATEVMTMPWVYYYGHNPSLEQKIEGLQRFREDVLVPLGALTHSEGDAP